MKELLCILTFDSWHRKCHSRQDNMGSLKCNFVVLTSNSRYQNIEVGKLGRFGEEPILLFRIPTYGRGRLKLVSWRLTVGFFFAVQLSTPNVQSIVVKVEKSKMVH